MDGFDLGAFLAVGVAGVPLMFVIIGLVGVFKRAGVKGNALLLISVAIGVVFGAGFQVTQLAPPTGGFLPAFTYGFAVTVYGVAMGIVASLGYDVAKDLVTKVVSSVVEKWMQRLTGQKIVVDKTPYRILDPENVVGTGQKPV